jgi:hypothetical protein
MPAKRSVVPGKVRHLLEMRWEARRRMDLASPDRTFRLANTAHQDTFNTIAKEAVTRNENSLCVDSFSSLLQTF